MSATILKFQSNEDRFWSKVDKSGECWEWTAYKNEQGYGRFSMNRVMRLAHRVVFEWEVGPIPDGMQVDHICHTRDCVRPDHLRLATPAQNQANRIGATSASRSGVRGVFRSATNGKWVGQVRKDNVKYVSTFDSIEEADNWVRAKRAELFGEFGVTA